MKSVPKQECYKLPINDSCHPSSFNLYKKIPEINESKQPGQSSRFLETASFRIYHVFHLILSIILFFLTYYCLYENYTIKNELKMLSEKFHTIELNEDFSNLKKRYVNDQFDSRIRDHIVVPDHTYIDQEATTSSTQKPEPALEGHIIFKDTHVNNKLTTSAQKSLNIGHIVGRHSNQELMTSTQEPMNAGHIINRHTFGQQEPTTSSSRYSMNAGHIVNRKTFLSEENTTPSSELPNDKDGSSFFPAHLCTCPIGFVEFVFYVFVLKFMQIKQKSFYKLVIVQHKRPKY